jgi:hypothetical protein
MRSFSASAPPLYAYVDGDGRPCWSPLPPDAAAAAGPSGMPFFYEPMLLSEATPVQDARACFAKTASQAARWVSSPAEPSDELHPPQFFWSSVSWWHLQ